ncbi:MAG: hypothetical protein U0166_11545 [Acidobacteriota bacterium]
MAPSESALLRSWLVVIFALAPIDTRAAMGCDEPFPAPLGDVSRGDLLRAIYPDGSEGGDLGVADDDGNALVGALYQVAPATDGTSGAAVLVETWIPGEDGLPPEGGAASYGVDLALVTVENGAPVLLALLRNASGHGGHGSVILDPASYRMSARASAIGLRPSWAHMGHLGETLLLFERAGKTFRKVFERDVVESNEGIAEDDLAADLDAEAMASAYPGGTDTLVTRREAMVSPAKIGAAGMTDLLVVETVTERQPDGTISRSTTRERWRFDEKRGAYGRVR